MDACPSAQAFESAIKIGISCISTSRHTTGDRIHCATPTAFVQEGAQDGFRRALEEATSAVDLLAVGGPSSDRALRTLVEQGHPQLPALLAAAVTGRPHAPALLHKLVACAGLGLEDELGVALSVGDSAAAKWQADGEYHCKITLCIQCRVHRLSCARIRPLHTLADLIPSQLLIILSSSGADQAIVVGLGRR